MSLAAVGRGAAALLGALVTWVVVATVLHLPMKLAWPGYAEALPSMAFTLPMMVARLALAAVATLACGYVLGRLSRGSSRLPWVLGGLLLLFFVPTHVAIGNKLPLWYHLVFLASLLPSTRLGARLAPPPRPVR